MDDKRNLLGYQKGWIVLTAAKTQKGFTLIELLIGLVIMGVLLALGMPAFTTWMQNVQIRNTAESFANGLQVAKAQAVRTNTNVQFIVTDSSPEAASVNSVADSATGRNWLVRELQPNGNAITNVFVQAWGRTEGSSNATVNSTLSCYEFTPLGRLNLAPAAPCVAPAASADANGNFTIDMDNSKTYTNKRPMRILLSLGGQVLMCDPDATAKAANPNNPQYCP